MSKKIDPQLKESPAFIFAKAIHGFNTRESARFASLFTTADDFLNSVKNNPLIRKYLTISREPDLRSMGGVFDTRSKIVMAYEKQRKAFLKIKEMRLSKQQAVDDIVTELSFECSACRDLGYRCHTLQEILRFI